MKRGFLTPLVNHCVAFGSISPISMNQKVNEWVKRFIKNRATKLEESTSKSQHKINLLIVEEVREYFEISISERTVARNLNVSQNVPRPSLQQLMADNVVRLLQERGAAKTSCTTINN